MFSPDPDFKGSPKQKTKRLFRRLVFLGLLFTTLPLLSCSEDLPTNPGCGDVYWDTSVDRCRSRDTGQFVKSSCCGR